MSGRKLDLGFLGKAKPPTTPAAGFDANQQSRKADPDPKHTPSQQQKRKPPPPPRPRSQRVREVTQQVDAKLLLDSTDGNELSPAEMKQRIQQLNVALSLMNDEILDLHAQIAELSKPAEPVSEKEVEEATRQYRRSDIEAIPEGTLREAGMNVLKNLRGDPNVTQRGALTPDQKNEVLKICESYFGQIMDQLESAINRVLGKRDKKIVETVAKAVLGFITRRESARDQKMKELVAQQNDAATPAQEGE